MSATRNDALTQLSRGIRQFSGLTAGDVLATGWPGLHGLAGKDIDYFLRHSNKPAELVARNCIDRSLARTSDPLGEEAQP